MTTALEEPLSVEMLKEEVERRLPNLAAALELAKQQERPMVFHQDAFAAGYHMREIELLGMVIKLAGLYGVKVMISGKNGETLQKPPNNPR